MEKKIIGVMGGTFDPIHLGHLVVANEVLEKYNMEKVIFVPAGNPPHKHGSKASSQDRYFMTNLAILSNEKFEVSDIELKKEEKSYTINTITELKEIYKDREIYFITGSDVIEGLPKWYGFDKLIKLCKFIIATRPNYKIDDEAKNIVDKYQERIDFLEVPLMQISSTDIRDRIKSKKSIKYLISESVERYIVRNKLYLDNDDEYLSIEDIKSKLKEEIDAKLYEHCLRVMEEVAKLAVRYNIDKNKARVAGLLHDCGKLLNDVDNELIHSSMGADIARENYSIHDEEILNAIRYHTTGREAMTMLEKIVYIADKIEPNRKYPGVEELRLLAYDNIDEALIKSLSSTIEYVKQRNLKLDIETEKALNYLNIGR